MIFEVKSATFPFIIRFHSTAWVYFFYIYTHSYIVSLSPIRAVVYIIRLFFLCWKVIWKKEEKISRMNELFVHWPTTSIRLGYTFILMRQHHKTQYRISKRFHAFICCIFFWFIFRFIKSTIYIPLLPSTHKIPSNKWISLCHSHLGKFLSVLFCSFLCFFFCNCTVSLCFCLN